MLTLKFDKLLELSKITVFSAKLENASVPMLLTELGIVIENNCGVFLNAPAPILVTEFGMVIDDKRIAPWNAVSPILLSFDPGANVTVVKYESRLIPGLLNPNAPFPILVTEFGISIDVNFVTPKNAFSPILSSFDPGANVTVVKPDA
jgi:hypothetical protein